MTHVTIEAAFALCDRRVCPAGGLDVTGVAGAGGTHRELREREGRLSTECHQAEGQDEVLGTLNHWLILRAAGGYPIFEKLDLIF